MLIAVILSEAKNLRAMRPFAIAQGDNFFKSFTINRIAQVFVGEEPPEVRKDKVLLQTLWDG